MTNEILSWIAFSSSLLSVWAYGHRGILGPKIGSGCALLFMLWGFSAGVWAAVFTNVAFLALHIKNYTRMKNAKPA